MISNNPLQRGKDYSRRGEEIYERCVRPTVGASEQDKFVAIDIDSESFELDWDDFTATEKLLAKQPKANIWLARVGQTTAYRLGGASPSGNRQ